MASATFKKLPIIQWSTPTDLDGQIRDEKNFWQHMQTLSICPNSCNIASIDISRSPPYSIAVATSTTISIYDPPMLRSVNVIRRFKSVAQAVSFRHDGMTLLVAGDGGVIRILDPRSQSVVKSWQSSPATIRAARFTEDGHDRIATGDDEGTLLLWDMGSEEPLTKIPGAHRDRITAIISIDQTIVTASSDHTVVAWDVRSASPAIATWVARDPCHDLVRMSGSTTIGVAFGPTVAIWDFCLGPNASHQAVASRQDISKITFDPNRQRILAGSLDGTIKILRADGDANEILRVLHTTKASGPISALGVGPAMTFIAVGTLNGNIELRQHRSGRPLLKEATSHGVIRKGVVPQRAISTKPLQSLLIETSNPIIIQGRRSRAVTAKLVPYESYLKTFKYGKALRAAIKDVSSGGPIVLVSLLVELTKRQGLRIALANEDVIPDILEFIRDNISNPHFSDVLITTAETVLDLHGTVPSILLQHGPAVLQKIKNEIELQKELMKLLGGIHQIAAG